MTVRDFLFGCTLEKVIAIFETYHFLYQVLVIFINGFLVVHNRDCKHGRNVRTLERHGLINRINIRFSNPSAPSY